MLLQLVRFHHNFFFYFFICFARSGWSENDTEMKFLCSAFFRSDTQRVMILKKKTANTKQIAISTSSSLHFFCVYARVYVMCMVVCRFCLNIIKVFASTLKLNRKTCVIFCETRKNKRRKRNSTRYTLTFYSKLIVLGFLFHLANN